MNKENDGMNNFGYRFVPVDREELFELIRARTERDLILAMTAENGFFSNAVCDLVIALARVNGFDIKKNVEDKV